MTAKRLFSVVLLTVLMALPSSGYQDSSSSAEAETEAAEPEKKSRKWTRGERRRKRVLEEYEATGEVKSCVPMRSLRQSLILDDQTIFFEAVGRKGYMVHLPNRCPGLIREERFAYSNSFGSLCRAQIITILDSFGRSWGSCSLGDFQEYKKKPKDESGEK